MSNPDQQDDDNGHVYSVRPEPPYFEENVPRGDHSEYPIVLPAGPLARRIGVYRLRHLARIGLVVAIAVLIVAMYLG